MIRDDDSQFWDELCDQAIPARGFRPLSVEESERELFAADEETLTDGQIEAIAGRAAEKQTVALPAPGLPVTRSRQLFLKRAVLAALAIVIAAAAGMTFWPANDERAPDQLHSNGMIADDDPPSSRGGSGMTLPEGPKKTVPQGFHSKIKSGDPRAPFQQCPKGGDHGRE